MIQHVHLRLETSLSMKASLSIDRLVDLSLNWHVKVLSPKGYSLFRLNLGNYKIFFDCYGCFHVKNPLGIFLIENKQNLGVPATFDSFCHCLFYVTSPRKLRSE